jgi:hypothetical protein
LYVIWHTAIVEIQRRYTTFFLLTRQQQQGLLGQEPNGDVASVKCGVAWGEGSSTWQRPDPDPPPPESVPCPFTFPLPLSAPAVQQTIPRSIYSLQRPDANSRGASDHPYISSKRTGSPKKRANSTTSITHTILQASTTSTARPLGPKTEKPETRNRKPASLPTHHQRAQWEAPLRPPPSSANRSSSSAGHRCFVCNRTYERADHLNRHLKSRKLAPFWMFLFFLLGTLLM